MFELEGNILERRTVPLFDQLISRYERIRARMSDDVDETSMVTVNCGAISYGDVSPRILENI